MTIMLTGCRATVDSETSSEISRFIELERTNTWLVVVDKETGVMYSVSNGGYNRGTFTLLVDENGKPLIWERILSRQGCGVDPRRGGEQR